MPAAIPNGGGGDDPTTGELAAYNSATSKANGDQTASDQQVIADVEAKIAAIAGGWVDSGGTGGRQAQIALEVAAFSGQLEADRLAAVNQWAPTASKAGPQARKAQAEMHGADTKSIVEMYRLLLELRERLNDSPY